MKNHLIKGRELSEDEEIRLEKVGKSGRKLVESRRELEGVIIDVKREGKPAKLTVNLYDDERDGYFVKISNGLAEDRLFIKREKLNSLL